MNKEELMQNEMDSYNSGKESWMHHTKWLLENLDKYETDPIVKQGIDQLNEAYQIVIQRYEQDPSKKTSYLELDETEKTIDGGDFFANLTS